MDSSYAFVQESTSIRKTFPSRPGTFKQSTPATGELLQDSTRGLLRPNNGLAEGEGFVTYSIKPTVQIETGDTIEASARVLFDTAAPEETSTITYMVDGAAPMSSLEVTRISEGSTTFDVNWEVEDDLGASGFKHVTIYVAEDGEDFKICSVNLQTRPDRSFTKATRAALMNS